MINGSDFEDKAARLLNRLSTASPTNKVNARSRVDFSKLPLQELIKIKEEIQFSDFQSKKKVRGLSDNFRKLQSSLVQDSQSRLRANETFNQTLSKIEKNMKTVISGVQKSFVERQKKLQQKIDSLIKAQSKEVELRIKENDQLLEQMQILDSKISAIVDEVGILRKARLQLEDRIKKQFTEQLQELKIIFEADIRAREERQVRAIQTLKNLYKISMEKIYIEEKQREQSQKMLMSVVQQLVDHILKM